MTLVERVNMKEAATRLGISHAKMWQLVRNGVLHAEPNPLDRRQKLVRVADIERLRSEVDTHARPRPSTVGQVDLGIHSDEIEEWLEANWRP